MNKFYVNPIRMLLWLLPILMTNCEKPLPELPKQATSSELQTVILKLNGFTSAITPLDQMQNHEQPQRSLLAAMSNKASATASTGTSYLYFWSFNQEDLIPDEAIHSDGATISFDASNPESDFTTGYGLSPYPAGKCLSLKGAQNILIHLPLADIEQLMKLEFDAGSSGTGPKNFKISYSTDDGATYATLVEDNQFTKIDGRNSYEYDLSQLSDMDFNKTLIFKIEPFEGERGDAGAYNPTTGTFKMDNIRLSGTAPQGGTEEPGTVINDLDYFVFNAENDTLVTKGVLSLEKQENEPTLVLRLPVGDYYASIFANNSLAPLMMPETIENASQLYLSNPFSNAQALIFGSKETAFHVGGNLTLDVSLKRYFSQIKFIFTDEEDLSSIHKIMITPLHERFVYSPFATPTVALPTDETSVTLYPIFTPENRVISFNQFMGEQAEEVPVSYSVQVYDTSETLLRTFEVSSSIKNNIQLTFTGDLLEGVDKPSPFQIHWDENWAGELNEPF